MKKTQILHDFFYSISQTSKLFLTKNKIKPNPGPRRGPNSPYTPPSKPLTQYRYKPIDNPIDKLVSLTTFISLSSLLTFIFHTPLIFFYLKYPIPENSPYTPPIKNQPLKLFLDCLRFDLDHPRLKDIPKQTK